MRSTLHTLIAVGCILCCRVGQAQDTVSTYYVIPPTNGCNGVWAFGPYSALWVNCGTSPYQWMFSPTSCVNTVMQVNPTLTVSGDTILMELCDQPCEFELWSAEGQCLLIMCELPGGSSVGEVAPLTPLVAPTLIDARDPVIRLRQDIAAPFTMELIDALGRSGRSIPIPGDGPVHLGPCSTGLYILRVVDAHGVILQQRIVLE